MNSFYKESKSKKKKIPCNFLRGWGGGGLEQVNFLKKESKSKNFFLLRFQIENKKKNGCWREGEVWGVGGRGGGLE